MLWRYSRVAIDFATKSMPARSGDLFGALRVEALERLAAGATPVTYPAGVDLIVEGDRDAKVFYVIKEGTAQVRLSGWPVAELGPGEGFGERALGQHGGDGRAQPAEALLDEIHRNFGQAEDRKEHQRHRQQKHHAAEDRMGEGGVEAIGQAISVGAERIGPADAR